MIAMVGAGSDFSVDGAAVYSHELGPSTAYIG